MKSSTDRRARARRVVWGHMALFVGWWTLSACADDSDAGAFGESRDMGGAVVDARPGGDVDPVGADLGADLGACTLALDGACYDDADVRCRAVADWVRRGQCTDDDLDCFVGGCRELPQVEAVLGDCDDRDPGVHPLAAEACDDVDRNCDGQTRESYPDFGGDCLACGREGKFECAVDDPYRLACSVAAGQSGALDPLPDELCDGGDQDCDGLVDEGCLLPVEADARLETPTVCPDGAVAVVEDGALVLFEPALAGPPRPIALRDAGSRPTLPACGPAGLAWLERVGEVGCAAPADGPASCPARVWFRAPGGAPMELTGVPGDFGRPAVGDDGVWWHTVVGGAPTLLVWRVGDDRPRAALDGAYSDPTPPDADRLMAVRAWTAGEARVVRVELDGGGVRSVNGAPAGQNAPGPPTRDGRWLAWSGGGGARPVLWVVTDRGLDGFRPIAGPGPQRAPRLAGDILVWLDEPAGGALRFFDLRTGDERLLSAGPVPVDGFAVRRGEAVWVEGEDSDRLVRAALPDTVSAPEPEPGDMGPAEVDQGPAEMDQGLVEVDQGAPDMGPEAPDAGPGG